MSEKKRFSLLYDDSSKNSKELKVETKQITKSANLDFEPKKRYRCTQLGVTKMLDEVTFSSNIKTQYLLSKSSDNEYFHTVLEDHVFTVDPIAMSNIVEALKPVEFIRNDIKFSQNENAQITSILNFEQLQRRWRKFRDVELLEKEFYQKLKENSELAAKNFIQLHDIEFASVDNMKKVIDRNLFHHVLLRSTSNKSQYRWSQLSQIFPDVMLNIDVERHTVSKDELTTVYRLVGKLNRTNLNNKHLESLYDEYYKPLLKFSYTEFDFIYRVVYTLDNETNMLIDATVSMSEKIKNNYESITQFTIKTVEL